jgi:AsmA family protein
VFDTEDTIIEGTGRADFANERLDLRVKPVPKDVSFIALRVPFEVKGPFKHPEISPDKKKLAVRAGAALLLGSVTPLAALIPLIETGPGKDADCAALIARAQSEGVPVKNEPQAGRR